MHLLTHAIATKATGRDRFKRNNLLATSTCNYKRHKSSLMYETEPTSKVEYA
ncbi:hypothetical protein [Nostoc sp. DedQUE09]|uniref:hypothetical protein n=1 Tax=Nostoc sp. DedQUE09 TaxID=3075394 RepID=UPI002AD4BD8A|nr:hypothetical protein [Nostoc sp. DedQUE09]MDZ7955761.1 hypothetical protein [Nostoc sp. DedQUE09]